MIEGDGTSIALQREEERRAEVKMGVAYEGWEVVGQDRYRLKEKMTYAGIMDGEKFWDTFSLRLAKRYDLAQIGQIIVGGDGVDWVKKGAEMIGGVYQLDRFHLLRALRLGLSEEAVGASIPGLRFGGFRPGGWSFPLGRIRQEPEENKPGRLLN